MNSTANSSIDPWVITQRERVKHVEQFAALKPLNGVVTGVQVREFFLQSQLPPIVLGEIWALADTDCDGRMDINEFSIACKLINMKLRSFDVPKVLPPALLLSLQQLQQQTASVRKTSVDTVAPLSAVPPKPSPPNVPPMTRPPMPAQATIPPQRPYPPNVPPMAIQATATVASPTISAGILPSNVAPVDVDDVHSAALPAPPTPPSGTPSRSVSISAGMASPMQQQDLAGEWAVRPQSKLKFTQLFNATDRTRSGFLTGAQARSLMVQSKLPQVSLAQIWALADMDADGRLGCEEFVLAMYLCECAAQGEKIPEKLPPELIPPMFRKRIGSVISLGGGVLPAVIGTASRHDSIVSSTVNASRHGSVSSQSGAYAAISAVDAADPMAGLHNQTSFEDKRKENYDKGQAELERRRKVLLDAQRKEQEERERKEREEADKREKARLEAEKRQQEEIERQLQRQREIEQEKEEKRLREIELKEQARKEMEKQRQLEWVKQRLTEMQMQRQHEQEHVLKLKSLNQTHNIDLSKLTEKIKELSQKICDTRSSVTNVKSVIDGMRSTRDVQMAEMAQFKTRILEQNQRLIQLSQEKAKLDSRSKTNIDSDTNSELKFSNKQILINQLRGRIESTKLELTAKQSDEKASVSELDDLQLSLTGLINECEAMYSDYDTQRTQLLELKNNARNELSLASTDNAWDSAWSSKGPSASIPTSSEQLATTMFSDNLEHSASLAANTDNANYAGFVKCRALYEFVGRNADEISFQPGDIVMVPIDQNAEPGWKAGEINGHTGWFPESYVEFADGADDSAELRQTDTAPVQSNAITSEITSDSIYIACYPYDSAEPDDLIFAVGERINVIKKDGDWWTGVIDGNRTGIFPSNYVQPANVAGSDVATVEENQMNNNGIDTSPVLYIANNAYDADAAAADDAKTLEDADSEVSEINTKPMIDAVTAEQQQQQEYGRPMSTTSTRFRKQKGEVAQVIAPYEATSSEQLSLTRGQLIMIRKKTDAGWWEGELQTRGRRRQIGWFPATYVKVLQSGRLSGRSTPVSGGKVHMNEAVLDKVIALYTYKAQNDDELSFEKDDIISVMGRNEPEWWYGDCRGLSGLFPSNYVGPFVNSG